ncbi:MAG: hypothetical protein KF873_02270 [Gemmataceae bacterium]|nr:hypothetical protein [Gemmataceae bacterium]
MDDPTGQLVAVVVRVAMSGQPAFQLRKGEQGLSVFRIGAVDPPLTDDEILAAFRPGSIVIHRTANQVAAMGLQLVTTPGTPNLPDRLQSAHEEIQPSHGMSRAAFKEKLRELE